MKIKLINPNTTQRMTDAMGRCAREVAAAGTAIVAVSPAMGPPSIEGHYDEALATPGLLAEVAAGERDGFDGYVIACFGDPGLYAARELARGPVIGIAEAAMHAASVLAPGFSVVTTLARTCGMAWHLAERYGMKRFCRNVRATDVAVLDLDRPGSAARRVIVDECRRALDEDGADAIVLGCAGMAEFAHEIEAAIGAPVVEGVTAAVKWAEALIALKLATAKRGDFARPLAKRYDGEFARFSPDGAFALGAEAAAGAAVGPDAAAPGAAIQDARSPDAFAQPHIHSV
ncbi:asp/Glu/Hydantoin racemase family protein [Burkholderia thailandensis E444]|uniref:aspartate/glutamate racemase family protein n=1 Tax=Burkholderia thailandensis TaxID=57975 RepID=UPI0003EC9D3A|nr:aspartate/glutamate racemase family protein [Burkholderia thailandensis]AHI78688.1 asp/Glu/Hydantoin racemase family protein [Burkholderia thailandensis E444]AWY66410.1 Asp/Glu racemase [Burkholderia thailandensis]MBS2127026.1 aspartate/glutamate racemase family protein [Burkholderia thailandensis]MCS6477214.1 aspartate/glutamate racemase family protein [Burkholderia thailandensis]MCS6512789.1 aspartate/glutamate racemase family protein [Burkholderia thailandensis]